jgi:PTS system nitrogen regulatory IIA component
MEVESLLNRDSVVCNAEVRSKKHALDLLSQLLANTVSTIGASEIFRILASRERLGCTALGEAVAIPHGRVAGIERNVGAFIKLREPVDFDSPDGEPVDLIFGLLVPEECPESKLDDLRQLSIELSDPGLQRQLRYARDADTLYELLAAIDHRMTPVSREPSG